MDINQISNYANNTYLALSKWNYWENKKWQGKKTEVTKQTLKWFFIVWDMSKGKQEQR